MQLEVVNLFISGSLVGINDIEKIINPTKFNYNVKSPSNSKEINAAKKAQIKSDINLLIISPYIKSMNKIIESIMYAILNPKKTVVYFMNNNLPINFEKSEFEDYKKIISQLEKNGSKIFYDAEPLKKYFDELVVTNEDDLESYLLNYYTIQPVNETSGVITGFKSVFATGRQNVINILAQLIIDGSHFTFFLYKEGVPFSEMSNDSNLKWQEEKMMILDEANKVAKEAIESNKKEN